MKCTSKPVIDMTLDDVRGQASGASREARTRAARNAPARPPWDEAEAKAFVEASKGHRLFGPMLLTLIAERPAEVCGARWREDVDLHGSGTLAVGNTRTIVYDRSRERGLRNKVVEKQPKTQNGKRVLPLPKPVHSALVVLRALQAKRRSRRARPTRTPAMSASMSWAVRSRRTSHDAKRRSRWRQQECAGCVCTRAPCVPVLDGQQRGA